jgi:hypothetical protein
VQACVLFVLGLLYHITEAGGRLFTVTLL